MLQYRKPAPAPLNESTHPSHECSHTHATNTLTINNTRVIPRRFEGGFSTHVGGFHHAIYASQCAAILPSRESSKLSKNHNGTIYVHILGPITSRREVLRATVVLGVAVAHLGGRLAASFLSFARRLFSGSTCSRPGLLSSTQHICPFYPTFGVLNRTTSSRAFIEETLHVDSRPLRRVHEEESVFDSPNSSPPPPSPSCFLLLASNSLFSRPPAVTSPLTCWTGGEESNVGDLVGKERLKRFLEDASFLGPIR